MNIRFEINKLGNEDVITTSAALTATPTCYKFIDSDSSMTLNSGDKYQTYVDGTQLTMGSKTMDSDLASEFNTELSNAGTSLDFSKYYRVYLDENGKYYLYECKDTTHTH